MLGGPVLAVGVPSLGDLAAEVAGYAGVVDVDRLDVSADVRLQLDTQLGLLDLLTNLIENCTFKKSIISSGSYTLKKHI